MKVLQFAFGEDLPTSVHIPHNHSENFVVYTGTHDNNTTRGWFNETDEGTRHRLGDYVDHPVTEAHVNTTMIHMAYASVAKMAIIPVQDLLNLDGSARMNMPASAEGNWGWRLLPGQFTEETAGMLKHLTALYNR
jgi:4-alpha-glucanotransferase